MMDREQNNEDCTKQGLDDVSRLSYSLGLVMKFKRNDCTKS